MLVALALGACGAAARPTSSTACGPSSARTLAADHIARVYATASAVYGCTRGASQRYKLGAVGPIREARVGSVALAATVVAYSQSTFGVDTISSVVVVRRLSDGKQLADDPAFVGPLGPEFSESVQSVVTKRDGSAAWIVEGGSIVSQQSTTEVVSLSAGRERILDSGSGGGIDVKSLRLQGSSLTWTHGGQTRSATLQ